MITVSSQGVVDTSALVREVVEALNSHDVERLVSLTAHDYEGVDVNRTLPQHGRGEARAAFMQYLAAFPDFKLVEHEIVVEASKAVVMWRGRGTHKGAIMHIPATGRTVEVMGTSTFYFEEGKIKRAVHVWDVASMLREIGLLPEL